MKRRYVTLIGNILMAIGIVLMISGIAASLLAYIPQLSSFDVISAESGLGGLFLGAFIWLIGAHFCGRERIEDRYWCIRREARLKQRHKHP